MCYSADGKPSNEAGVPATLDMRQAQWRLTSMRDPDEGS